MNTPKDKVFLLFVITILAILGIGEARAQFVIQATAANNTFSTAENFPSPTTTPTIIITPTPNPCNQNGAEINISGNGAGSVNDVSISANCSIMINQASNTTINNNIQSNTSTGGNITNDTFSNSGTAKNEINVSNKVGVNDVR